MMVVLYLPSGSINNSLDVSRIFCELKKYLMGEFVIRLGNFSSDLWCAQK